MNTGNEQISILAFWQGKNLSSQLGDLHQLAYRGIQWFLARSHRHRKYWVLLRAGTLIWCFISFNDEATLSSVIHVIS